MLTVYHIAASNTWRIELELLLFPHHDDQSSNFLDVAFSKSFWIFGYRNRVPSMINFYQAIHFIEMQDPAK